MIIIITRSYGKKRKRSYFAESLHSEINEIEEIGFREEHYSEVISHLIIERMGRFPCEGETLKFGPLRIEVDSIDDGRIERVSISQEKK